MREKLIRILTEIRPEFDFTEKVNFIENGMLDSFDIFNLVSSLDNEFGISIDGMDILLVNFSSLERIESLLYKNGVKS
jgi:acyl carrier protein